MGQKEKGKIKIQKYPLIPDWTSLAKLWERAPINSLIFIGWEGTDLTIRSPQTQKDHPIEKHKIFAMPFANFYPHYVAKAEKKGRSQAEVGQINC